MEGVQEATTTRLAPADVALLLALWLAAPAAALAQQIVPLVVPANAEWTDTGIDVLPGDRLGVVAGGEWSNVASGPTVGVGGYGSPYAGTQLADAPLAALIQRIGTSVMRISPEPVPVTARGRLYLGMNDVPGTYGDNRGRLSARIDYIRRPAPIIDFTGSDEDTARKWLSAYQFTPQVEKAPSGAPAGRIYDQDPKAGVDLHGVAEVRLFASTGPPPEVPRSPSNTEEAANVAVPPVVGWPVSEARVMLDKSLLKPVDGGDEPSAREEGVVTRTDPIAGTPVKIGSPVTFFRSSGANVVPRVLGYTTSSAYDMLRAAGFRNVSTAPQLAFGASGRVLDQSPAGGARARLDASIELTESYAPPAPAVGIGGALALLVASGLVTRGVRNHRAAKTRARFRLDAELDPKATATEPDGPELRGPAVRLRVELEAGEMRIEGAVPVVKREVRDG